MVLVRGIIDRITNRDIVRTQAEALEEFEEKTKEFQEQLTRLHNRVVLLTPEKKEEKGIEPTQP